VSTAPQARGEPPTPHAPKKFVRRGGLAALLLVYGGAACSPPDERRPARATTSALADSADQLLIQAMTRVTDKGVLRAELNSDTAFFFQDNTKIEMRNVRAVFYSSTGTNDGVLVSKEGTYDTRAGQFEARGDVVVVSVDGRRLTTPRLRFDQALNQVTSDTSFVVTEPDRELRGIGFVSDPNLVNVRVLRGAAGTVGRVALPDR
jgi:LPS export ABC transporter protein LptC